MNRALPKVSVVTITYGHEKYITETLDGVLMQQYDGLVEFIIANDNSPDETDEVMRKYFLENPAPENFEIKYTKHETNKGMMPNFVWALEQATGEYIALCEGDDYWTDPLKLQKQVDFLEENEEYVLTGHWRNVVDEAGNIMNFKSKNDVMYTQCMLFRNVLKNDFLNNKLNIFNGDTFLTLYLENFGKFKIFDFIGANYRISNVGVWSLIDQFEKRKITRESYKNMLIFFKDHNYFKSVKKMNGWLADLTIIDFKNGHKVSNKQKIKTLLLLIKIMDYNRIKSYLYYNFKM